jgi:TRAF-interacting protein
MFLFENKQNLILVCLMQWMERSKSCPQCRNKCTERNIIRIYFNNQPNLDTSNVNQANLLESIDNMTLQMREKEQTLKEVRQQKEKIEETMKLKE